MIKHTLNTLTPAAIALAALLSSGAAFATSPAPFAAPQGSQVGGDLSIDVQTTNVMCAAAGSDNLCEVRAGVIDNASVSGDAAIGVYTGEVMALAAGSGNVATVSMGVIENATVGGSAEIRVSAGDVVSLASGSNNRAEVSLGVVR